jgi:hypothetical protein
VARVARPSKTLQERIRDRSFLARRHDSLLAGPLVRQEALREVQERWQTAASESERVWWAREFEKIVLGRDAGAGLAVPMPSFNGIALEDFFADYLVHVKGQAAGQPFVLEPWQSEFLAEFDRLDEFGCRIYSRGLLGVPRGCGKSPLAAGRALYDLVTKPDAPDVFTCAASKDQARIVLDYARGSRRRGRWRSCSRWAGTTSQIRSTAGR